MLAYKSAVTYNLSITRYQHHCKMPQNKAADKASENTYTSIWSPEMMLTFLRVLEKQDNLGKYNDTGWKPKA